MFDITSSIKLLVLAVSEHFYICLTRTLAWLNLLASATKSAVPFSLGFLPLLVSSRQSAQGWRGWGGGGCTETSTRRVPVAEV